VLHILGERLSRPGYTGVPSVQITRETLRRDHAFLLLEALYPIAKAGIYYPKLRQVHLGLPSVLWPRDYRAPSTRTTARSDEDIQACIDEQVDNFAKLGIPVTIVPARDPGDFKWDMCKASVPCPRRDPASVSEA